jgi:hypothetical protein
VSDISSQDQHENVIVSMEICLFYTQLDFLLGDNLFRQAQLCNYVRLLCISYLLICNKIIEVFNSRSQFIKVELFTQMRSDFALLHILKVVISSAVTHENLPVLVTMKENVYRASFLY